MVNQAALDTSARHWFETMLQARQWWRHGVDYETIRRRLAISYNRLDCMLKKDLPQPVINWLCRAGCPIRKLRNEYPNI
jgi:hypothetical protein